MSESGDYEPAPWSRPDESFQTRRQTYDQDAGRSYADRAATTTTDQLVPKHVTTKSTAPFVIVSDVTGSMGEWPAQIFGKLPYLDHEARTMYLGNDMEISFAAVADARTDKQVLQVRPFAKGEALATRLQELLTKEHGGGGQRTESYELAALYYARNVAMPNAARRPIIIFIADEGLYENVDRTHAKKYAKVDLQENMSVAQAFEELRQKFSVYLIRKNYSEGNEGENAVIHQQWARMLGADHIAVLPSVDRVLDVILGILAKEVDRVQDFMTEIEGRQRPDQVKEAYKSLATIHSLPAEGKTPKLLTDGKSRLHGEQRDGPKSRPLV